MGLQETLDQIETENSWGSKSTFVKYLSNALGITFLLVPFFSDSPLLIFMGMGFIGGIYTLLFRKLFLSFYEIQRSKIFFY